MRDVAVNRDAVWKKGRFPQNGVFAIKFVNLPIGIDLVIEGRFVRYANWYLDHQTSSRHTRLQPNWILIERDPSGEFPFGLLKSVPRLAMLFALSHLRNLLGSTRKFGSLARTAGTFLENHKPYGWGKARIVKVDIEGKVYPVHIEPQVAADTRSSGNPRSFSELKLPALVLASIGGSNSSLRAFDCLPSLNPSKNANKGDKNESNDFNDKAVFVAGVALFIGGVICLYKIMWQVRFNLSRHGNIAADAAMAMGSMVAIGVGFALAAWGPIIMHPVGVSDMKHEFRESTDKTPCNTQEPNNGFANALSKISKSDAASSWAAIEAAKATKPHVILDSFTAPQRTGLRLGAFAPPSPYSA